jgi:hypothetical protein
METRVVYLPTLGMKYPYEITGTVIGIASFHIIFIYIMLLDKPLQTPEGMVRAIAVPGVNLMGEDGTDFRKMD